MQVASPMWDHWADVPQDTDVRDGQTRALGTQYLTYADGDAFEVINPHGAETILFVVVFVMMRYWGTAAAYKRIYLIRDVVDWDAYIN